MRKFYGKIQKSAKICENSNIWSNFCKKIQRKKAQFIHILILRWSTLALFASVYANVDNEIDSKNR